MGGSALKKFGIETRRLSARDYRSLEPLVLQNFTDAGWRAVTIPSYRNKPDFGDMDVLVQIWGGHDLRKAIQEIFNPRKIFSNGGVFSFDFSNFQIDAISVQPECLEIALTYFSWNDLGNLMGRIAHKFGIRYGYDGLLMMLRERMVLGLEPAESDHVVRSVLLTREPDAIFSFLGYDFSRFLEGFDDLEDIYRYAVSTRFFNSAIYHLDNRNHRARTRDRKRPTYTGFLEWLEEHPEVDKGFQFKSKEEYFRVMVRAWKIEGVVAEEKARLERRNAIKAKFNGSLVMEWIPELKDDPKRIGRVIGGYRQREGFEEFVLDASPEDIREDFLSFVRIQADK